MSYNISNVINICHAVRIINMISLGGGYVELYILIDEDGGMSLCETVYSAVTQKYRFWNWSRKRELTASKEHLVSGFWDKRDVLYIAQLKFHHCWIPTYVGSKNLK